MRERFEEEEGAAEMRRGRDGESREVKRDEGWESEVWEEDCEKETR